MNEFLVIKFSTNLINLFKDIRCKYIADIPTVILLPILLFIDCSKMARIRINIMSRTKGKSQTIMRVLRFYIYISFPW